MQKACWSCLGALLLLCASCIITPPLPPPVQRGGHLYSTATALCSSDDMKDKVTGVTGFKAAGFGNCVSHGGNCTGQEPESHTIPLSDSKFGKAIASAYSAAPYFFKLELCRLNAIYVDMDPNSTNSTAWGMRESMQSNAPTHIGLQKSVFTGSSGGTPGPEASWETGLLNGLLLNGLLKPQYASATTDSQTLMLLSMLAHEVGHIIWWRDGIADQTCPNGGDSFFYTWKTPISNPHQYHDFGQPIPTNQSSESFTFAELQANAQSAGSQDTAKAQLRTIYGFPNDAPLPSWASLFAFVAPDEDFIETYKLLVLTQASPAMTSLIIQIPTASTRDVVVDNFKNTDANSPLIKKKTWIEACYEPPQ